MSSVSSGWNAATRILPSRASTGWPSTSARISTSGPAAVDPRCPDEDGPERRLLPFDLQIGLEARDLAAERVALHDEVDQAEPPAVEHDHAGARAEDRRVEAAERLVEPVELHQAQDRGGLAAGDDEPVEPVELVRQAYLDDVGAQPAQHGRVLAKRPLECKNADAHDGDCTVAPCSAFAVDSLAG